MIRQKLVEQIKLKKSFLCIGLDTEIDKIPEHLKDSEDPQFEFNKAIIDATRDFAVAYKPNLAFYEYLGERGMKSLQKTLDYIPDNILKICDAKRGDIGNTGDFYAKTFFETFNSDAVTINPYMGEDSVKPFLKWKDKWTILLALTSNDGFRDFQTSKDENGIPLYKKVIEKAIQWDEFQNLMFVVGATRSDMIREIREISPNHFFLVPGVGYQGGKLEDVTKWGLTSDCGLLINSSRSIIWASNRVDFAEAARLEAEKISYEMSQILTNRGII